MTTRKAAPKKAAPKYPEYIMLSLDGYNPVAKKNTNRCGSSTTTVFTQINQNYGSMMYQAVMTNNFEQYDTIVNFGSTEEKILDGVMVNMMFRQPDNDNVVALAGVDREGNLNIVMVEKDENGSITIHHRNKYHDFPACHNEGLLAYYVESIIEAVVVFQSSRSIFG